MAASLEGRTLGKYQVLEPLGSGGMARVYRGYHPQLDRFVAIKVLRSDLVEDDLFLTRFRREAQSVANLRHANIIQVHDFDVEGDVTFMVMELLDGDTLHTRLNDYRVRDEHMPWGEMVRILLDVLDGLAYAHQAGMIHRDIKPANILLTRQGQAVLADFGIAQIVGGTRHTVTGALLGTLNYMAPEQGLRGISDARSNIYSLGIVFYEMLTRQPPYEADTPLAILMKHVNDPLPLPRQLNTAVPVPFERVVLKALAKQPEDRYQNAEEMAAALRVAADEAAIALPARISLPLSFTTQASPAESVAVFSGTARAKLHDAEFAAQDTSATQVTDWDARLLAFKEQEPAPSAAEPSIWQPSLLTTLIQQKLARPDVQRLARFLRLVDLDIYDVGTGRAIINSIGLVVIGSLLLVMLSGVNGAGRFFGTSWPAGLFLVAGALLYLMASTKTIWLFIPAGSFVGNAFLMSYYTITGNWQQWAFLWPLEVFIVLGAVLFTVNTAVDRVRARDLSVTLGRMMGRAVLVGLCLLCLFALTR
ncbi:MAG: protein kinase [Chloroflexota bacterium]